MAKTILDKYSPTELEEIVKNCTSWRKVCAAIGYNSHSGAIIKRIQNKLNEYGISTDHITSSHGKPVLDTEKDVLIFNSQAADKTIRDRYFKGNYSEYKCSICGLEPFWNGKELVLTLDHINGNHNDSRPENLRWVCPNCDRQLPTFGGRNHKYK